MRIAWTRASSLDIHLVVTRNAFGETLQRGARSPPGYCCIRLPKLYLTATSVKVTAELSEVHISIQHDIFHCNSISALPRHTPGHSRGSLAIPRHFCICSMPITCSPPSSRRSSRPGSSNRKVKLPAPRLSQLALCSPRQLSFAICRRISLTD